MNQITLKIEEKEAPAPRPKPTRIGLILTTGSLNLSSIKFFLLSMNKAQPYFEYEILPRPDSELIQRLNSNDAVDRIKEIRPDLNSF